MILKGQRVLVKGVRAIVIKSMGGVDHAHIICVCSKEEFNYDTFLERDDIPFEWKEGLRKAKAMEEYLKERFPENPEGLKEVC